MATEKIVVPEFDNVQEITVVEVYISPGDNIKEEDPVIALESEKAVMDIPSPFNGVIQEVFLREDDSISSGDVIATIETEAVEVVASPVDEQGRSGHRCLLVVLESRDLKSQAVRLGSRVVVDEVEVIGLSQIGQRPVHTQIVGRREPNRLIGGDHVNSRRAAGNFGQFFVAAVENHHDLEIDGGRGKQGVEAHIQHLEPTMVDRDGDNSCHHGTRGRVLFT